MSLTLLTLNIEGNRHLDRIRAVIATHLPDIVCLQEVFEADCAAFAAIGNYQAKFAAMGWKPAGELVAAGSEAQTQNWGSAVLTRVPVQRQVVAGYSRDMTPRLLLSPNDPRRLVIVTELEHQGRSLRIITTHFTWSPGGQTTDEQRDDFKRLQQVLLPYPHYVLCGDFNSPRGREMFGTIRDRLGLVDHLPPHIATTIDPVLHRAGALQLAVDTIFATPDYHVSHVRVLDGVSDHMGILATVQRA